METGLYRDIVYTEYMLEHDLTYTEMLERVHVDEMLKRVAHMEWQDEQRAQWMSGETPQFTHLLTEKQGKFTNQRVGKHQRNTLDLIFATKKICCS